MTKKWIVFLQCLLLAGAAYGKIIPAGDCKLTIVIEPVFNGQPLQPGDHYYVTGHGDTVYIDLLKFYLTDIYLKDGKRAENIKSSFLFNTDDPETASFTTSVTAGTYGELQFVVGVDSIANTSGANGGDLDPVKGMYWAWNSGYIMAKLEGRSDKCITLHHAFEFHIGGYKTPYNTARPVLLQLPQALQAGKGGDAVIKIKADVAAWFGGNLDIAKTNSIVIPGKDAAMMADNYAHMFSVAAKN